MHVWRRLTIVFGERVQWQLKISHVRYVLHGTRNDRNIKIFCERQIRELRKMKKRNIYIYIYAYKRKQIYLIKFLDVL